MTWGHGSPGSSLTYLDLKGTVGVRRARRFRKPNANGSPCDRGRSRGLAEVEAREGSIFIPDRLVLAEDGAPGPTKCKGKSKRPNKT